MVARCDTWWITLNACESKISMCEARRFLCCQDPEAYSFSSFQTLPMPGYPEAYSFSSFQTLPMPGCILRSVPASSHMYSSLTCLVPACHSGGSPTWATLSTWFMFISLPCLPCFAYLRPSYNPSIRLPAKGAEYCQTLFHILSHKWLPATGYRPGHLWIQQSDKAAGFYADAGSPPPLLEAQSADLQINCKLTMMGLRTRIHKTYAAYWYCTVHISWKNPTWRHY